MGLEIGLTLSRRSLAGETISSLGQKFHLRLSGAPISVSARSAGAWSSVAASSIQTPRSILIRTSKSEYDSRTPNNRSGTEQLALIIRVSPQCGNHGGGGGSAGSGAEGLGRSQPFQKSPILPEAIPGREPLA